MSDLIAIPEHEASALTAELKLMRRTFVNMAVTGRIQLYGGPKNCTSEQVAQWEHEAEIMWAKAYPLAQQFITHFAKSQV